jgi:P27 family predicted phage terminase small subunit
MALKNYSPSHHRRQLCPDLDRPQQRLKIIRGNPGKQAIRAEPEPTVPPQVPEAPDFLNLYARMEWNRVAEELFRLGLLTVVDLQPLAAYCSAYDRWRTAEETLAAIAADDPVLHGLVVKTAEGNMRRNPLVQIASDAAAAMVRYAAEFGLTPASRSRISVAGSKEPESKFGALLVG